MNTKNIITVVIITLCVATLFFAGCLVTSHEDKQYVSVPRAQVSECELPTPVPTPTPVPGCGG